MYFKPFKRNSQYVIKGEKGGVVPAELRGRYTKLMFAEQAIQAYENKVKYANKASTSKSSPGSARTPRKKSPKGDGSTTTGIQSSSD